MRKKLVGTVAAVLAVCAVGVGVWTVRGSNASSPVMGASAVSGPNDAEAKKILIACGDDAACQSKGLQALVKAKSPEVALKVMDAMSARNSKVLANEHVLAHEVGYAVYDRYPTLGGRLSSCRDNGGSGCFHGVMMKHIGAHGVPKPAEIAIACEPVKTKSNVMYFQCLHGLGHGTMMGRLVSAKGEPEIAEIRLALADCDHLPGSYEQQSCYGGAFMEYLIAAKYQIFHYVKKPKYHDDDLHWPCNVVESKYVSQCYQTQGRVIMDAKKWNFKDIFAECAKALDTGRGDCFSNVGREILPGPDRARFQVVVDTCGLAADGMQRGLCLAGAARNVINYNQDIVTALTLCKMGEGAGDELCIQAVKTDALWIGWTEDKFREELDRQGLAGKI